jgi:hypothetical protein
MTELRCPDCEALIERIDECYECTRFALTRVDEKTTCINGHPWNADSTIWRVGRGTTGRRCRTCEQESEHRRYLRDKATRGTTRPRERAERSIGAGPHQPGGLISQTLPVQETA